MSEKLVGRLIPLCPLITRCPVQAAENMAIDQVLFESVESDQVPILRLYQWSEPTLSLGYFQKLADRNQHPESAGVTCVRRSTGGGGILHHHEMTYSIAMPVPAGQTGPRLDLYVRTHRAAIKALAQFGVRAVPVRNLARNRNESHSEESFLCFQRRTPEDLIVGGYKILGSAQRKSRRAVLQHGSLLLRASPWAPQLPGVCDLGSREIAVNDLADEFASCIAAELSTSWRASQITVAEHERAQQVAAERFDRDDWLTRR